MLHALAPPQATCLSNITISYFKTPLGLPIRRWFFCAQDAEAEGMDMYGGAGPQDLPGSGGNGTGGAHKGVRCGDRNASPWARKSPAHMWCNRQLLKWFDGQWAQQLANVERDVMGRTVRCSLYQDGPTLASFCEGSPIATGLSQPYKQCSRPLAAHVVEGTFLGVNTASSSTPRLPWNLSKSPCSHSRPCSA